MQGESLKYLKSNRGPCSFCFNTFYVEDELSFRGPMKPMLPTIRAHPSDGTEQGDIDCFHFSGVSRD